ncbi:MAG: SMC-Scp complex subunit ScpB [Candidatus Pacebacteria bacterium]|nr:SMC-Scp complex subunit ScpB [Candidatus Paceibacterota bacterium]
MLTLDAQIEAILFFIGEPVSKIKLTKVFDKSLGEIEDALLILNNRLEKNGVILITDSSLVSLGTSPEASELIEFVKKDDINKELSKSSLETLAIVLYKGPITRAQIDYIRGVNSTFILRNLHIRGLIEKVENPDDSRSYLYKSSIKLLSFLGISKIEDLPEFNEINKEMEETSQKVESL